MVRGREGGREGEHTCGVVGEKSTIAVFGVVFFQGREEGGRGGGGSEGIPHHDTEGPAVFGLLVGAVGVVSVRKGGGREVRGFALIS